MKPNHRLYPPAAIALVLLMALVWSACTLPSQPEATQAETPTPNPAYTAAAETIVAQLTRVAGTDAPTQAAPAATEQPAEPQPTEAAEPAASPSPTEAEAEPTAAEIPATEPAPEATEPPQPTATTPPTVAAETAAPTAAAVESTTAPASTPEATTGAAATQEDPAQRLGEPTWVDEFDTGENWPLFNDAHTQMQVSGGQLQMTALIPDIWNGWMLTIPEVSDVYLEGTFQPQACGGLDRFGLLVRAPNVNSAYLFGVACDGRYTFMEWNGIDYTPLVDWTASEAVPQGGGQAVRLGVWAEGPQFRLYVNGRHLTDVTDDTTQNGTIGLFVGAGNTPGFTVQVDRVAYWELP